MKYQYGIFRCKDCNYTFHKIWDSEETNCGRCWSNNIFRLNRCRKRYKSIFTGEIKTCVLSKDHPNNHRAFLYAGNPVTWS